MVYVKEQVDKQPSIINLEEFKNLAVLKTNNGMCKPCENSIHFSAKYNNNKIGLERNFPGKLFSNVSVKFRSCQLTLYVRNYIFHNIFVNLYIVILSFTVGFPWILVDDCYVEGLFSVVHINTWHTFFTKLGVLDFLAVDENIVTFNTDHIVSFQMPHLWLVFPQDSVFVLINAPVWVVRLSTFHAKYAIFI